MAVPISRQTLTKALLMTLNVTGSICSRRCSVSVAIADPHFWEHGRRRRRPYLPSGRLTICSERNRHHPGSTHLQPLTGVDDGCRADLLHDQWSGCSESGREIVPAIDGRIGKTGLLERHFARPNRLTSR